MRKYCWIFVLLTIPLSGQNDAWKKYESATGNFSVLIPVELQDTVVQASGAMQTHLLQAKDKTTRFMIIYSNFPEQSINDASYQSYKEGVFSQLPICEVGAEQPPAPALNGYIGHWYKLNCSASNNKITVEGNLYCGKRHSYAVLALFPAGAAEPASVKKFTGSFALLQSR